MRMMVRLYPATWRARYGDEFEQLLLDNPPSLADRLDLARGAMDARLHPQLDGPSRVPDRRGLAPLAGILLFGLAIAIAANGPLMRDEFGTYREGGAALPFFILAMLSLCVGLYALIEHLPNDAGGTRAAGWVAIGAGVVWSMAPWLMAVGLVFLVSLLVLAVGSRRAGLIGAAAEIGLAVAVAIPAGLFLATLFLPWYAFRVSGLNFLVILVPLAAVWLMIGLSVHRGWPATTGDPVGEGLPW